MGFCSSTVSPVNNRDNIKRSLISRGIHGEGHPFLLDLTRGPRPLFHFKIIHLFPTVVIQPSTVVGFYKNRDINVSNPLSAVLLVSGDSQNGHVKKGDDVTNTPE